MEARSLNGGFLGEERARFPQDDLSKRIRIDPRAVRVCCGRAIEPYLGEIRDSLGPSLFVSVWPCPHCSQVTF